jgi:hypothetical protein
MFEASSPNSCPPLECPVSSEHPTTGNQDTIGPSLLVIVSKKSNHPPKKMGQSEQHLLTVTGHPKSRNKNDRFSIVKVSIAVFQLGQAAPGADGNGEMVDLP